MDFVICPVCGQKLVNKFQDGRDRMVCEGCGYIQYKNPLPAAAILLVENGSVLMVKRKFAPRIGDWCLPAGFIEADETPQQAAVRETKEETGLDIKVERLFTVTGTCEGHKENIVLIIYVAGRIGGDIHAGDDALDAAFFPIDRLPDNIAFSSHKKAIKQYWQEKSHTKRD